MSSGVPLKRGRLAAASIRQRRRGHPVDDAAQVLLALNQRGLPRALMTDDRGRPLQRARRWSSDALEVHQWRRHFA